MLSVYNNGLIRIQVDENKIRPKYFYYIVRSKACQDYIQSIAFGTSTQPNMKIKDFLRYEFEYFDLKTQDKVISLIEPIEQKIFVNDEINNTQYMFAFNEENAKKLKDKYNYKSYDLYNFYFPTSHIVSLCLFSFFKAETTS